MLAGFLDTIRRMAAEMAAQALLSAFFQWGASAVAGMFGGAVGGTSTAGTGNFVGPRAGGGPVMSGGAYLVGERGPELLVMGNRSGSIIPNGGGGMAFTDNIDARGADAERIMAVLPPLLKQNKDQTISELLRMQRQGRFA